MPPPAELPAPLPVVPLEVASPLEVVAPLETGSPPDIVEVVGPLVVEGASPPAPPPKIRSASAVPPQPARTRAAEAARGLRWYKLCRSFMGRS